MGRQYASRKVKSLKTAAETSSFYYKAQQTASSLLHFSRKTSKKCQKVAFSLEKPQKQPISHDPCITK
jgi:hypothetical protein